LRGWRAAHSGLVATFIAIAVTAERLSRRHVRDRRLVATFVAAAHGNRVDLGEYASLGRARGQGQAAGSQKRQSRSRHHPHHKQTP
jgi:hypothetical protein